MPLLDLGDGLELRPLRVEDADELFELTDANRARLANWLPWVAGTRSADDTRAYIRSVLAETGVHWVLVFDGSIAGTIGLHPPHRAYNNTTIGYWLGAAYEGRGFMTRAVRAVVDHGFREVGLNRIQINCAVDNERSRAIPERLGFRLEGVLREKERLPDRYVDIAVYGMLARDWAG